MKKKLLVIGDSPTVQTGFAVVVENILLNLPANYDIAILGINYYGDPHKYQTKWRIYNPNITDVYGFGRLIEVCQKETPDLIWIVNDIWLASKYVHEIRRVNKDVPIVIYTPIDSPGIKPEFVKASNAANHVIAYTEWGKSELIANGLTTQTSVAFHGVNLGIYRPIEKKLARQKSFGDKLPCSDPYIVLYCARNQSRKRVDLFLYTMAKWMQQYPHENVYAHYHGQPKGDLGNNTEYLAEYFSKQLNVPLDKRFIVTSKDLTVSNSLPVEQMPFMYNNADVYLHVCAVEGWGLPVAEAMACGIPTIVPNYSALSEWPKGAVHYVDVDETPWMNTNDIDTEHRFMNVASAVEALEYVYQQTEYRKELGIKARNHMEKKCFRWQEIAKHFDSVFKSVLGSK